MRPDQIAIVALQKRYCGTSGMEPPMSNLYPSHAAGATRADDRQRAPSERIVRVRVGNPPVRISTALDERRFFGIRYADSYHYFDTVKYLVKRPISPEDQAWLRRRCKHLDTRQHGDWAVPRNGKPYQINIWPWRFRVELQLPDRAALEYFAALRAIKLSTAHPARDFTFDDPNGKHKVLSLYEKYFVQPRQRRRERIIFDNGGFSTGRRSQGHYFVGYLSKECRIDGVVDCWHVEGRYLGNKALAQIGIHSPADLLGFDHAGYWSQKDRQLLALDCERLGRYHYNRHHQKRRQHSEPTPFYGRRSEDAWRGSLLWRIHAIDQFGIFSVQSFIRGYGKGPFLHSMAGENIFQYSG
jgi:hypothetical protein